MPTGFVVQELFELVLCLISPFSSPLSVSWMGGLPELNVLVIQWGFLSRMTWNRKMCVGQYPSLKV